MTEVTGVQCANFMKKARNAATAAIAALFLIAALLVCPGFSTDAQAAGPDADDAAKVVSVASLDEIPDGYDASESDVAYVIELS